MNHFCLQLNENVIYFLKYNIQVNMTWVCIHISYFYMYDNHIDIKKLLSFLFVKISRANDMTLFGWLPPPVLNFRWRRVSSPLCSFVFERRRRGRAWRTSDRSAAASCRQQMQPDPQIDARAYAPDRILEWTFPPSPGWALHHLSFLWKDMGNR